MRFEDDKEAGVHEAGLAPSALHPKKEGTTVAMAHTTLLCGSRSDKRRLVGAHSELARFVPYRKYLLLPSATQTASCLGHPGEKRGTGQSRFFAPPAACLIQSCRVGTAHRIHCFPNGAFHSFVSLAFRVHEVVRLRRAWFMSPDTNPPQSRTPSINSRAMSVHRVNRSG